MHRHYTSYFTFDAITEEQERRVQEMNAQYGGDVVAVSDIIVSDGKFLAISATSIALIALLRKEAEKLNLSGFRHEALFDRKDECDDEACVILETRDVK